MPGSSNVQSSGYKPRIIPIKGNATDAEMDRVQSIDPSASLNRERVEEVGREGLVGYIKKSPSISYRLTQYEYGNIEMWQKIVNTSTLGASGQTGIQLTDFKTPYFDILAYLTDDDGVFQGTVYYPSLRTSGFSITIGDPQATIERSFDFVGESAQIFTDDNKYVIYGTETISSGGDNDIDLSTYAPAVLPDEALTYMLRVTRYRPSTGVTTELVDGTDFNYVNGTTTLTIVSVVAADVIKYWYTSATAPATQFTNNDSDVAAIQGDSVDIYLYVPASGKPSTADYIYRLQSVSLSVSFEREDIREIGNKSIVARGVNNSTVSASLGKILDDFTVEEILRGAGANYGQIDIEKFSDQITLIVKIYDDNEKGTFKYGFKASGMSPVDMKGPQAAVNTYSNSENTLEGEVLIITADATVLGI